MPFQIALDLEKRRLTATFAGDLTLAEALAYVRGELPAGASECVSMVDLRAAKICVTPADVWAIIWELREHAARRPAVAAVLVSSDLAYGLARVAGSVMGEERPIRPFRALDQAEAWLDSMIASP